MQVGLRLGVRRGLCEIYVFFRLRLRMVWGEVLQLSLELRFFVAWFIIFSIYWGGKHRKNNHISTFEEICCKLSCASPVFVTLGCEFFYLHSWLVNLPQLTPASLVRGGVETG